jgi:hypothetical protein
MAVAEPPSDLGLWPRVKALTGWPDTDEDRMRVLAESWELAAASFGEAGKTTPAGLSESWQDAAGTEFLGKTRELAASAGRNEQSMRALAAQANSFAGAVEQTKTSISGFIQQNIPLYAQLSAIPGGAQAGLQDDFVNQVAAAVTKFIDSTASVIAASPVEGTPGATDAAPEEEGNDAGKLSLSDGTEFGDGDSPVKDEDKKQFGDQDPKKDAAGEEEGGPNLSLDLGKIEGELNAFELKGASEAALGDLTLSSEGSLKAGVNGELSATLDKNGLEATAKGGAAVTAAGELKATLGPAEAKLAGTASLGAEAEASLAVGKNGVHAGASAFAGSRAEVEASADVAGIGAGVKAEGWVGVGAEANVDFGFKDGKFTIGGEAGIGLGVGGKIGGEITIDPAKVVETAGDVADAIGDGATTVANDIGEGVQQAGDWAADLFD